MSDSTMGDKAEELERVLTGVDSMSIRQASELLDCGPGYVRILAETFPERFSMVGIAGYFQSWAIGITDPDRPIHFVLEKSEYPQ